MSIQQEERKRKWDLAAESQTSDPLELQRKIQAILAQNGVAPAAVAFEKEISINDCNPQMRLHLCKGTVHEELTQGLKATIKTRGKYKSKEDTSLERPLHLFITADSQEDLNQVSARVEEYLRKDQASKVQPTFPFIAKVQVGMEGADPQFNLLSKLLGPNGSFVQHIERQSKAKVILKGVGSGFKEGPQQKESAEPLHFFVGAQVRTSLDAGKSLCDNLLSHVRQDYFAYTQAKSSYYSNQYANSYSGYGYQYPGMAYGAYPPVPGYPPAPGVVPPAPGVAPVSPPPVPQPPTPDGEKPKTTPAPPVQTKPANPKGSLESANAKPKADPKSAEPKAVEDDLSLFYSEISQITAPTTSPPKSTSSSTKSGVKSYTQSSSTSSSVKDTKTGNDKRTNTPNVPPVKLVDYDDEQEAPAKKSSLPFWAASNVLDSNYKNPLKQREETLKQVDDWEKDVYKELGLKK